MHVIFIFLLCMLASTKVTLQGLFAKQNTPSYTDTVLFNGFVFLVAAFLFCKDVLTLNPSVLIFSSIFGILTILLQLFYVKAMSCANVSLTVLIVNLSMIVPILVAVIFYSETLSGFCLLGIFLILVSLILSVDLAAGVRACSKRWLTFTALSFFANGGLSVCLKVFSKTQWAFHTKTFVATAYAVATILSFLLYLLLRVKHRSTVLKLSGKVLAYALAIGLLLGAFQFLNARAVSQIDAAVLFPAYHGGALILSYIASIIVFKERLTHRQKISMVLGMLAIIFINL